MTIKTKEIGTRDLWAQFKDNPVDLYKSVARDMKESGVEEVPTLSRVLEEVSPSKADDQLDAFERLMMEAGIRTNGSAIGGYYASGGDKFGESAGARVLFTEFAARNWRKITQPDKRGILLNSDAVVGSWERPYYDSLQVRPSQQIQPAIPLDEIVAMTTGINSDAYRSYYLAYDATATRKYRVGESAEIPVATITGSTREVRLKKYGRGISISYEAMRRLRVDKIAWYIQWMAVQTEIDKVAAAIDVLINGDGNANTAATSTNMTTLDSGATAGTLTLKAWESFKMLFDAPYIMTTALMQKAVALQLRLLNTGSANVPLTVAQLGGGLTLINQLSDGVRYGYTSDAPTLKIVGLDKRVALERITEIGADISEMERAASNQTQTLYLTEVEGYAINDANGTRVLDINS